MFHRLLSLFALLSLLTLACACDAALEDPGGLGAAITGSEAEELKDEKRSPSCGNGTCNGRETCATCPSDCGSCGAICGDDVCDAEEDCSSCASDCGPCGAVCGDDVCDAEEDCSSCASDCGTCGAVCGDDVCDAEEDCSSCASDCGTCGAVCGDDVCDAEENCSSCASDCGSCADDPAALLTSMNGWQGLSFAPQSGQLVLRFEATPLGDGINAITGLSSSAAAALTDNAVIVRFSPAGTLDVRDGGVYRADTVVPYQAGQRYRFVLLVDIAGHRYSVWVEHPDGTATTLASDYAFRTEQATATSLDHINVWAADGAHELWSYEVEEVVDDVAACGNGACGSGEDCSSCPQDCGTCPVIGGYSHSALLARRSGFAEQVTGAGVDADDNATMQVWVTNTNDAGTGSLRAALSQPYRWIRFDDSLGSEVTIELTSGPLVPAGNVTLDGRGKHVVIKSLHNGSVFNVTRHNQIYVNLEVVAAGPNQDIQADCFNINGGSASPADNIWIHHTTMRGARDKRVGVSFGGRVTLDWNEMSGSTGHGVLVGCKVCSRPDVSYTTMSHNYLHGLPDRYPRISDGHHAHAYNNVCADWDYYAMGAVRAGELLAEGNWFVPTGDATAIKSSEGSNARGYVRAVGNVLNGGTEQGNEPERVFTPPYAYTLDAADAALRDRVMTQAGWQPASFWAP